MGARRTPLQRLSGPEPHVRGVPAGFTVTRLTRFVDAPEGEPLDLEDGEVYSDFDREEVRAWWDEAVPDAAGMLDAPPWVE